MMLNPSLHPPTLQPKGCQVSHIRPYRYQLSAANVSEGNMLTILFVICSSNFYSGGGGVDWVAEGLSLSSSPYGSAVVLSCR